MVCTAGWRSGWVGRWEGTLAGVELGGRGAGGAAKQPGQGGAKDARFRRKGGGGGFQCVLRLRLGPKGMCLELSQEGPKGEAARHRMCQKGVVQY